MKRLNKFLLVIALALGMGLSLQSCAGGSKYGCPDRIQLSKTIVCLLRP